MKNPALLFLVTLLAACARTGAAPEAPEPAEGGGEIRCELVSLERVSDESWNAAFRVRNTTQGSISYLGYTKESPIYRQEVLEGGAWQDAPMGWCGTGTETFRLEPGKSLDVTLVLPADGRSYRFRFGEPAVVTPPVTAKAQ